VRNDNRRLEVTLGLMYALLACGLSVTAALPDVRRVIPMSDVVTSLHGSFFGWGLVIGGLFGHRMLVDSRRRVLLIGSVVGLGLGAIAFGTGTVLSATLGGAAVIGASGAALVVAMPAVVADAFGDRRGEVFTRLNAAPAVTGMLSPLSLAVAPTLGVSWRVPVVALPLICVVAVTVAAVGLRGRRFDATGAPRVGSVAVESVAVESVAVESVAAGSSGSLREPFRHPPFRRRFVLQVLALGVEFSLGVWIVTFLRESAGLSRALAPIGGTCWALGILTSRLLVPRLIRTAGTRLEALCFATAAAGTLALVLIDLTPVRLLAVFLTSSAVGPLYTLGVERLFITGGDRNVSAISSIAALASGLAASIGPFIVGFVADRFDLRAGVLTVSFAAICGLGLCQMHWGGEAGRLGIAS
jgi:MFS family permease